MNPHLRTVLVSVLSAGAGWVACRWSQREQVEVNQATAPASSTTAGFITGSKPTNTNSSTSSSITKKRGEHAKQLRTALEEQDPLKRAAKYFEILAATTADNAAEVREVWKEYQATGKDYMALEPLTLYGLGKALGTKALTDRIQSSGAGWQAWMAPELEGVVAADPVAARKWFDAHPDEAWREAAVTPYLCAMAKTAPQNMAAMLNSLDPDLQAKAVGSVASTICGEHGADGTLAWLKQLVPPATSASPAWLKSAYDVAITQMAKAPVACGNAARVVEETAGDGCFSSDIAAMVAGRYAWSGATNALEWSERIALKRGEAEPQLRMKLVCSVLSKTLDHDATAVSSWCASRFQGPDRDRAKATLLKRIGTKKPELAAKVEAVFAGSDK